MHFKSLELSGFKSFADRTRFEFEPGVTAVIGPNGCGKSNIADSIRWVLGEQNARLLRGQKMEDVIFSGSDLRKPLGLAEVSITLSGVDGVLPVDYGEITVTRRVFRSGEGQYLINKNPCRLKDIDDLFMGTGIGLSAYSIMEQGKMDMILSSKPEDRRFIFEEAAGITKYKERKREALRKLDATEENLVRLSDIIKEVRRQLASVERQAARARRAREAAERLKAVELQLAAKQLADLDEALGADEETLGAARRDEESATRRIGELEEEGKSLHERLMALDAELGTVHARRVGVSGSIEGGRTRIEANGRQIREIEERELVYAGELEEMAAARAVLQGEERRLAQALEAAFGERAPRPPISRRRRRVRGAPVAAPRGGGGGAAAAAELIGLITLNSSTGTSSPASVRRQTASLRGARLGVEERSSLRRRIGRGRRSAKRARSASALRRRAMRRRAPSTARGSQPMRRAGMSKACGKRRPAARRNSPARNQPGGSSPATAIHTRGTRAACGR